MKRLFITGTDTEIGKTVAAVGLVHAAVQSGYRAAGLKPIAAGCELLDGELKNDDALRLIQAANVHLDYQTVNPIALEPPIAPHIAATRANVALHAGLLKIHYDRNLPEELELAVFEGAGGWFVPLNEFETFQDFAVIMQVDVVLVVGMQLGCINHALLTVKAIQASGLKLLGWIANFVHPEMPAAKENLEALMGRIESPLLGAIPFLRQPTAPEVAKHLNIKAIMQ